MINILILSHTRSYSDFKIGSHHYANELSNLGYNVYFSGVPETIFHKLLKKNMGGPYKLNEKVIDSQIQTFFPITLPLCKATEMFNVKLFPFLSSNKIVKANVFDVVICDYPYFYPLLKIIKYKKLIYRPTDDYYSMGGEKVLAYESRICFASDAIICTSEVVSSRIKERYKQLDKKISVITNGFDDEKFYIKETNYEGRSGAVYIGALDNRFDFDALHRLAKDNRDVLFDIFGPINSSVESKVNKIKLLDNVKFNGSVDYNETNNILNKYKVGLLLLKNEPSNRGRSPMKLWEYIACGLNVLYSNIDNIGKVDCAYRYESEDDLSKLFKIAYQTPYSFTTKSFELNSWKYKSKEISSYFLY